MIETNGSTSDHLQKGAAQNANRGQGLLKFALLPMVLSALFSFSMSFWLAFQNAKNDSLFVEHTALESSYAASHSSIQSASSIKPPIVPVTAKSSNRATLDVSERF